MSGTRGAPSGALPQDAQTVVVVVTACCVDRGVIETLGLVAREVEALNRSASAAAPRGEEGAESPGLARSWLVFNVPRGSLDGADLAEVEPLVERVLFEPAPGKSHALNLAVGEASADVLVFTDDDARPVEGWLARLTRPLLADPGLAGVGGPVEPILPPGGAPRWYTDLLAQKRTHFLGPKHSLEPGRRSYELPAGNSISPVPLGANCAWRRDWLLRFPYRPELGPSRATGTRGGEDTCLAMQVLATGGRVRHVPEALVTHPVVEERIDLEYVAAGFRSQGRELVRILRVLDRPLLGLDRFRRHAAWPGPLSWLGPLLPLCVGRERVRRRELRRAFAQGILEELRD